MADIKGTIILSGKDQARRRALAAEKAAGDSAAKQRDAIRQLLYRVQKLEGTVATAEAELSRLKREAVGIAGQIEEAQAELVRTGKRDPELAAMRFASSQSPEVIAAAETRLAIARNELADAKDRLAEAERKIRARAAAEAEVDRLAAEREAQIEALERCVIESEAAPVAEAPRGRGRPSRGAH